MRGPPRAGTRLLHVPYKGGAQINAEVMAGNIDLGFGTRLEPPLLCGRKLFHHVVIPSRGRNPGASDGHRRSLAVRCNGQKRMSPTSPSIVISVP
jgi:hypothetical protein